MRPLPTVRYSYCPSPRRRALTWLLLIYPVALLVLSVVHLLFPQRAGPVALTQVFAPYLFLPLVLLLPVALFMRGATILRLALLACALVYVVRFFPSVQLAPPQEDPDALQIEAMAWNLGFERWSEGARQVLLSERPDLVSFEESHWEWIEEDQALTQLYPYRITRPEDSAWGIVLLSKRPLVEHGRLKIAGGQSDAPRVLWARVDLGKGETITVLVGHPLPPYPLQEDCVLPPCYDTALRDAQIEAIRLFIDPRLARGDRLLIMGDFNVTEREPAYVDLAEGLQDAYRQAGSGNGNTWRPDFLMQYPLGLLRIDYMLTSPNVTPLGTSVDCTPRGSDHCILRGRFELN